MTTETKITKTPTKCPSCNGYGSGHRSDSVRGYQGRAREG